MLSASTSRLWAGPATVQGFDAEGVGAAMDRDYFGNSLRSITKEQNGPDTSFTWNVTNTAGANCPYLLFKVGDSLGQKQPLFGLNEWNNFTVLPAGKRMSLGWPIAPFPFVLWKTSGATVCLHFKGNGANPCIFLQCGTDLFCVVKADLKPGDSQSYTIVRRLVAPDAPLDVSLGAFIAYWRSIAPRLQYEADARPVVHWIRSAREKVAADNPFGFVDWRPDLNLSSARDWTRKMAMEAAELGFQAVIAHGFAFSPFDAAFWGYPIDGADLPYPASLYYREAFARPCQAAGLNVGCVQRAGILQTISEGGQVNRRKATGSDEDVALMLARLGRAGSAFYFDVGMTEGGATVHEGAALLRRLRDRMGPKPQIWLEAPGHHLLYAPYVGAYADLRKNKEDARQLPFPVQVLKCIYPNMGILANDAHAEDYGEFERWCAERAYACYVPDWKVGEVEA